VARKRRISKVYFVDTEKLGVSMDRILMLKYQFSGYEVKLTSLNLADRRIMNPVKKSRKSIRIGLKIKKAKNAD
jgi:hypothetical protein